MTKTTRGRIVKPKNTKEGLELAARIFSKHQADGTASELNQLQGFDWNVVGPTILQAQSYHEAAETFKSKMEEHYRLRDAAYKTIEDITNASSTFLKGKYSLTPKKLGDWGYQVDDTAPVKKAKPAKA